MGQAWFGRSFELGLPVESLLQVLARLRATPLRLEALLKGAGNDPTLRPRAEAWSMQEHAGHLADLEPLWLGRIEDLMHQSERLRDADLENRATWNANHNGRPLDVVLAEFRSRRKALVARVESMRSQELRRTALHPRLSQPMTVTDLCFFVAEHDDHHLAAIDALGQGGEEFYAL